MMLLVGCLVEAAPELGADVELLSEPAKGLVSEADEFSKAGVRPGVSKPA